METFIVDNKFQSFPSANRFAKPNIINEQKNIISGPNTVPWKSGMMYWTHSGGDQQPMAREEGPFPIQGNIGSLVKQEGKNDFASCSLSDPLIGGSRNCTNTFNPDEFTPVNTCGQDCIMKAPESFGDKDFGLVDGGKFTDIHGIHAYQNVRAASSGQGPSNSYGCYEDIPSLSKGSGDTCYMNQAPAYQTVGDWGALPQYANIVHANFSK